jgi:hypothetical protein
VIGLSFHVRLRKRKRKGESCGEEAHCKPGVALSTVNVRHSTNNDFQVVANNRIGAFQPEGSDD